MPKGIYGTVRIADSIVTKIPRKPEWAEPEAAVGRTIMSLPFAELYYCAPTDASLTMPYRGIRIDKVPVTITAVKHLLDGLSILHDADMIHGDITPTNILVDTDGIPRFIDFWRPNAGRISAYSSPEERAAGKWMNSKAIDCWRLGRVLNEVFGDNSIIDGLLDEDPVTRLTASQAHNLCFSK